MRPLFRLLSLILITALVLGLVQSAFAALTIQTVDSSADVGSDNAIALDGSGNPMIAYFDDTNDDLKFVHCDDPSCLETETPIVLQNGTIMAAVDMELNASGNPVIVYGLPDGDVGLLVCNNTDCSSFVGPSIYTTTNPFSDDVTEVKLELDSSGYPVITFFEGTLLTGVRCNDAYCLGSNESILGVNAYSNLEGIVRRRNMWESKGNCYESQPSRV